MLWNKFGIHVGNNIHNSGTWDQAVVQADADYHKSIGIQYVRIPGRVWAVSFRPPGNANGQTVWERLRTMVQIYRALNIDVQYIIHYGSEFDPSDEYIDQYLAFVASEATWAESVGVTRLQLDNELEGNSADGITHTQVYNFLQTLPAIVTTAGFTGEITYSVVPDHDDIWLAQGLGNYDTLGFDSYGSVATFISKNAARKAAFGDNAYLSEWGLDSTTRDIYKQDSEVIVREIMDKYQSLKAMFPNHVNYYHCWKNENDNETDAWSASTVFGDIRKFWYPLTGQRYPLVS